MPAAIEFLVNIPIAFSDKPVLSEIDANSDANSPENATDVPNSLFNDIWAATTSLVDTRRSPDIAAASDDADTKALPSLADIPMPLATSPDAPSISLKASTNCSIAIAISAAGPKAFMRFLPIVLAIPPATSNLPLISRAFVPPSVKPAAVSLAPLIASSIPNLPDKSPNPAWLKPFDSPLPMSCRDRADSPKGRIASSIVLALLAISAILAASSFNC